MRKYGSIVFLSACLATPFAVVAEEETEAEKYIYATYFYCKAAGEDKVDEMVKKNTAPVYDAAVADGTISSWGWVAHHTGGKWRRIQYHMSDSVSGLLKAQDVIAGRVEEATGGADDTIGTVCGAHDDYIWKVESGNGIGEDRGTAGLSVYHVCTFEGEERADEIVEKHFGPLYDKAIESGKITSWGWSSHVIGGKYRRLQTMTAANYDNLLAARAEILEALYGDGDNAEANEFSQICGSHSDYLWEVVHEKP